MSINTDYSYSYYNNSYYTQQAAKKEKGKPDLMSLIDTNEDKSLNSKELSDFAADFNAKTGNTLDLSSIMGQYDLNGDGELNESEQESMNKEKSLEKLMSSGMQNRQIRMMDGAPPFLSKIDQDGNGSLNSDELTQFINKINEATDSSLDTESLLQKYDTDSDGSLNLAEQAEMMKDMAPPASNSSTKPSNDDDEKIREKMKELRMRLSQNIRKYENNFWFENANTKTTQYGA